jgi:hypothetical protein
MPLRFLNLLLRQLERLRLKWRELAVPYRLYVFAAGLAAFGLMRNYLEIEHSLIFDAANSISVFLFGFGFVLRNVSMTLLHLVS